MAKGKKQQDKDLSPRIRNRRAHRDYQIHETLETGIQLRGTEVKSIRNGQVSLDEGFARVEPATLELFLLNVDIPPYTHASDQMNHEPKRPRKLLAHKSEIRKLEQATTAKGTTLIPLAMYFKHGRVKVEIGLAAGKQHQDKRQDLKKREADREIRRAMARKTI